MNRGQLTEVLEQLKMLNENLNEVRKVLNRIDGRLKPEPKKPAKKGADGS